MWTAFLGSQKSSLSPQEFPARDLFRSEVPQGWTLFFLTSVKTKPTYRASLLRGRWRSRQTGQEKGRHGRLPPPPASCPEGHPATRRESREDRWWKGVGMGRAAGGPKGKPGATRVTFPLQVRPVAPEDGASLVALGKPTGAVRRGRKLCQRALLTALA